MGAECVELLGGISGRGGDEFIICIDSAGTTAVDELGDGSVISTVDKSANNGGKFARESGNGCGHDVRGESVRGR